MASEAEFHKAVVAAYNECKSFGYYPSYFIQMVADRGAVGAAKDLLAKPVVSSGFERLWEEGRLDLSVEAIAIDPQFRDIFTPEELGIARRRLKELGKDA